ncbi:MAG: TolC family protein [Victivallales bacterium]|nr:TolC family protein [Victivallales bacterium]
MRISLHSAFSRAAAAIFMLMVFAVFSIDAHELDELLNEAAQHNPDLLAAKWRAEQMLLRHQELLEFYAPALTAAIGQADRTRSIPGASGYSSLTNNATELQAGVDMAVDPGFYIAFGGSERVYNDPDKYDYLAQTLFGVRIRIPLLRNRGFKNLSIEREMALAEYNAAVSNLLDVAQRLRRDVTLAYIAAYESLSSYKVTQEATVRFERLVNEAKDLNKLKVIPEYQIFDAQMDLQLGLENEEIARNRFTLNLINLSSLIGGHRQVTLKNGPEILFQIASETKLLEEITIEEALEHRGSYLQIKNNLEYARAQIASALEEQKDDVTFNMGVSWQGEMHDHFDGSFKYTTDRHVGADASIIWKRTLDYRGPRARQARQEARIQQLKENLRSVSVDINAQLQNAVNNFRTAQTRIEIVNKGIEASQKTLEAEQERFRLGEGTSSNVTDAQKELTSLQQRRTSAAADLLRAKTNYQFAIGYNGDDDQEKP